MILNTLRLPLGLGETTSRNPDRVAIFMNNSVPNGAFGNVGLEAETASRFGSR
jgi:hypothetical protein